MRRIVSYHWEENLDFVGRSRIVYIVKIGVRN